MNGNKWTGTKIVGFILVFLAGTTFFAFKYMSADQWSGLVKWLFAIFVVGNAGITIASLLKPGEK